MVHMWQKDRSTLAEKLQLLLYLNALRHCPTVCASHISSIGSVKFIYSEKATKFCEISINYLWPSQNIWTLNVVQMLHYGPHYRNGVCTYRGALSSHLHGWWFCDLPENISQESLTVAQFTSAKRKIFKIVLYNNKIEILDSKLL